MQKTFFIKTYGCQMNERDSEIMAQKLGEKGYIENSVLEGSDLVILNTCSIRAKAEQKVMSQLGYLRKMKVKKPSMKICVAGCVAQQEGKRIIEKMPHVDLVLGTQNIYEIAELVMRQSQDAVHQKIVTDLVSDYDIPHYLPNMPRQAAKPVFSKFVTIMQGCNNFCSYCVVPYTRGREISRKVSDIAGEIKKLVKGGIKEITLLGQNVNSYGQTNSVADKPNFGFAELLVKVSEIEGVERLRFTTSHPKDLTDELINCFATLPNLCPQFHLPVQSGSDNVLARMNRKYTVGEYLEKADKLVEVRPDIAISTDIIVGFPGETDADFEGTMELLNRVRYHGSFSFKYSDRPGTASEKYVDKVEEEVKSERLSRFQARQDEISLERNREYVDTIQAVMFEQVGEESSRGRTPTNHIVHVNERLEVRPGDILPVKIIFAGQHSLKGVLV